MVVDQEVNFMYLLAWSATIGIGMLQFGLAMGVYNFLTVMIPLKLGYNDNKDLINSLISTVVPLGAAIGALGLGGVLPKLGRKVAMLLLNILLIFGVGITLILNLTTILLGRFLMGLAAGSFSVISPMFISEIAPEKLRGPLGVVNQFMVTFGILLAYIIGIAFVPIPEKEQEESDSWRWIFGFPLIFAVIQIVLLILVFRLDSPKYYTQIGSPLVNQYRKKIYRSSMDQNNDSDDDDGIQTANNETPVRPIENEQVVSFKGLWGRRYRWAVIVGCCLSLVQQFTGINAVVFYSTDIFRGKLEDDAPEDEKEKAEQAARIGTLIFGIVNMVSTLGSAFFLNWFGRKTLILAGQLMMAISLGLFVMFTIMDQQIMIKVMTMIFTLFFEISIGPILWLYLAEILPEAGISIAVFLNWAVVILVTFMTPVLINWSPAGTFGIFCGFCLAGGIFVLLFMKETRGLMKEEVEELYVPKDMVIHNHNAAVRLLEEIEEEINVHDD